MKMNTKGFTLIELLAVIIILAIIALIATPIVLTLLNDARKSAAEDSTYGIIKSAEYYYSQELLENPEDVKSYKFGWGTDKTGDYLDATTAIEYKGTAPSLGQIEISDRGDVTIVKDLVINNFKCKLTGNTVECVK